MPNQLFYGDNLPVLRDHVRDESVDLIYLDPPFNSNASYVTPPVVPILEPLIQRLGYAVN